MAAVSAFLGAPLCIRHMREAYGVSTRGAYVSHLVRILRDAGLAARPVQVDPACPGLIELPAIALWNRNHFIVVAARRRGEFEVFDPEYGWRIAPEAELAESLSGIVVEVAAPGAIAFPLREPLSLRRWIGRFDVRRKLLSIGGVMLLAQAAAICLPLLAQRMLDSAAFVHPRTEALWLCAAYVGVGAGAVAFNSLSGRLSTKLSSWLTHDLSLDVARRVLGKPLDFLLRNPATTLYGKIQTVQSVHQVLLQGVGGLLVSGSVGLVAAVVLAVKYPRFATALVTCRALGFALDALVRRRIAHAGERHHRALVRQMGTMTETIRAAFSLRIAGALGESIGRIDECSRKVASTQAEVAAHEQSRADVNAFFGLLDQMTYLALAATMISGGSLSLGQFVSVGLFRQFVLTAISEAQSFLSRVLNARVAMGRLEDVVDPEAAAPAFAPPEGKPLRDASVRLEGVCFRYSSFEDYVIRDFDLEVADGECVAIVGPSGSGKSTLAKLLTSLKPTAGVVRYGGERLDAGSEDRLLRNIGAVMQADHLVSDSIRENVRFFRDIPDDAIREACRLACIDEFIASLPMGYDTPISDDYGVLSGGQRQRILLARALASGPRILVLDEATSALDAGTEQRIAGNLRSLTMTRILFAHRQETIRIADRVVDLAARPVVAAAIRSAAHA
ncbi:MAG TPA: ATP-binding cassette domain-containing protein [Luteimonas sp.]|nr:ATP-binding cassette domain-containing protein [Luteimonas sp.]